MNCKIVKSVNFDEASNQTFIYNDNEDKINSEFLRDLNQRKQLENCVFKNFTFIPQDLQDIIATWRNQSISVVLGNLGRQPFLLTYYLDLCFNYTENVKIVCAWELNTDYQTTKLKHIDFLIYVEPYFGFTIHKDPTVKHLIILTSHLSLCFFDHSQIEFYYLNFSDVHTTVPPNPDLQNFKVINPPIFHKQVYDENLLILPILLDVSKSRTAHEAYLRLLTGREIVNLKPFNIRLRDRDCDIIRVNLKETQTNLKYIRPEKIFRNNKGPIYKGILEEDFFLYNWLKM